METYLHFEDKVTKWSYDIEVVTTVNKIIYKDATYRVIDRVYNMDTFPVEYHVYLKK